MNKTAVLVKEWAEFEERYPEATIEDFCRFFLISKREKEKQGFLGGIVPPDLESILAKIMGRIAKLHMAYAAPALKECGINNFEDFMFLNSVYKLREPRKTEVIYQNFNELSSGLLIIDRLKKSGFITEENDKEDKRSKRLKTTEAGVEILKKCYGRMFDLNKLFFNDISVDDMQLCIQLITPVEVKFSALWLQHKGKSFGEIQQELAGNE
jgi:predicted transcriptional regulator